MFEVPQGVLRELRDLRQEVERLRARIATIAAEAAKRIAELEAALKEAGQSTAGTTSSVRPGGREDAGRG